MEPEVSSHLPDDTRLRDEATRTYDATSPDTPGS